MANFNYADWEKIYKDLLLKIPPTVEKPVFPIFFKNGCLRCPSLRSTHISYLVYLNENNLGTLCYQNICKNCYEKRKLIEPNNIEFFCHICSETHADILIPQENSSLLLVNNFENQIKYFCYRCVLLFRDIKFIYLNDYIINFKDLIENFI